MAKHTKHKYIDTVWETWSYDVWGNAKDGYDVNDRYCISREYPIRIKVETANEDKPQAFDFAFPTDKQIRDALQIKPRVKIEIEGDDLTIYASHASSGYPFGEMYCTSRTSLSPIRDDILHKEKE